MGLVSLRNVEEVKDVLKCIQAVHQIMQMEKDPAHLKYYQALNAFYESQLFSATFYTLLTTDLRLMNIFPDPKGEGFTFVRHIVVKDGKATPDYPVTANAINLEAFGKLYESALTTLQIARIGTQVETDIAVKYMTEIQKNETKTALDKIDAVSKVLDEKFIQIAVKPADPIGDVTRIMKQAEIEAAKKAKEAEESAKKPNGNGTKK